MAKRSPAKTDLIAAIATAPGRGGVGVVRVSGPDIAPLTVAILERLPAPRHATFSRFLDHDGEVLDEGIALVFAAPHSFTGEHVLELQGHGSAVLLDLLLRRVCALGARLARPGRWMARFSLTKLEIRSIRTAESLLWKMTPCLFTMLWAANGILTKKYVVILLYFFVTLMKIKDSEYSVIN